MSEIKFAVPPRAMEELEDLVRSSGTDHKKEFLKLYKAWKSSERSDEEEWIVTISPPTNIVHHVEITKSQKGTPDSPRHPIEK